METIPGATKIFSEDGWYSSLDAAAGRRSILGISNNEISQHCRVQESREVLKRSNHAPVFTSSEEDFSFSELANTTNSYTPDHLSGTHNFKDSDKTDTHTTSASLHAAV